MHYYRVHHVQPSCEFYDLVMSLEPRPAKPKPEPPKTESERLAEEIDQTFAFRVLNKIMEHSIGEDVKELDQDQEFQTISKWLQKQHPPSDEPSFKIFQKNMTEPKRVPSVEQLD